MDFSERIDTILNWTELSPERHWRGPRSQEVGGEGSEKAHVTPHFHHENDPALRWVAVWAILSSVYEGICALRKAHILRSTPSQKFLPTF